MIEVDRGRRLAQRRQDAPRGRRALPVRWTELDDHRLVSPLHRPQAERAHGRALREITRCPKCRSSPPTWAGSGSEYAWIGQVCARALPGGVGRHVARGPDRPGLPGGRQRGQRRRPADLAVAAEADAVAEAQVPVAEAEQGDPVALAALQGGARNRDVVPPERGQAGARALGQQRSRDGRCRRCRCPTTMLGTVLPTST